MKLIWLTVGAIVGSFLTSGAILATEIWREYRKANENDPWQEYSSEDKIERKSLGEVEPRTVFDLNQERMFKIEMYERDSEDDEESDQ